MIRRDKNIDGRILPRIVLNGGMQNVQLLAANLAFQFEYIVLCVIFINNSPPRWKTVDSCGAMKFYTLPRILYSCYRMRLENIYIYSKINRILPFLWQSVKPVLSRRWFVDFCPVCAASLAESCPTAVFWSGQSEPVWSRCGVSPTGISIVRQHQEAALWAQSRETGSPSVRGTRRGSMDADRDCVSVGREREEGREPGSLTRSPYRRGNASPTGAESLARFEPRLRVDWPLSCPKEAHRWRREWPRNDRTFYTYLFFPILPVFSKNRFTLLFGW